MGVVVKKFEDYLDSVASQGSDPPININPDDLVIQAALDPNAEQTMDAPLRTPRKSALLDFVYKQLLPNLTSTQQDSNGGLDQTFASQTYMNLNADTSETKISLVQPEISAPPDLLSYIENDLGVTLDLYCPASWSKLYPMPAAMISASVHHYKQDSDNLAKSFRELHEDQMMLGNDEYGHAYRGSSLSNLLQPDQLHFIIGNAAGGLKATRTGSMSKQSSKDKSRQQLESAASISSISSTRSHPLRKIEGPSNKRLGWGALRKSNATSQFESSNLLRPMSSTKRKTNRKQGLIKYPKVRVKVRINAQLSKRAKDICASY